jgi:hypothetical protein
VPEGGLDQMDGRTGANFSASHLTIDVGAASAYWYQGTASQAAGGSFLAAIPFVLQNCRGTDTSSTTCSRGIAEEPAAPMVKPTRALAIEGSTRHPEGTPRRPARRP